MSNFTEFNSSLRNRWGATSSGVSQAAGNMQRVASAAWSTMQTVAVVVGVAAGVGALTVAAAGLIVAAITTFNLNTYYYGQIGALTAAVLDPAGPLFVDTTAGAVYLDCVSGSPFALCPYFAYVNTSIVTFAAFMNNGTLENDTLASLPYFSSAPFMFNVTNGKLAIDNLVGEAGVLQTQINALLASNGTTTLSTLPYTNGAAFMFNVTNGKTAIDNLVGEDLLQDGQIATLQTGVAGMNVTLNALLASNGTTTLSTLPYANGAAFMFNATNGKTAIDNLVGEDLLQDGQIATLQGQTAQLLAATSRTFYVSATYGNDGTCDATKTKPCATLSKTLQFYPNVTSQFAQNTVLFDNGLYSESNYIAVPPNVIFAGNEIGTLLIFAAGAGYHPTAWSYTGTGYVSWLRWGLIRCTGAPCAFNEADVLPVAPIFATHRFYNSTLEAVTPFSFTRANNTLSYLRVIMESTVLTTGALTFQNPTDVTWSISGDIYATITINYDTLLTYFVGSAVLNMNGLVPHAAVVVNNYVSGLTVDWSLMNVIARGSATLTRNYVSGAAINVHGDVLSLGSINGGLLSTGAGSGSTEYLTNAPGLGYTPTTSGDWSPAPTTAQGGLDQLAARMKVAENAILPQRYLVTGITGGAAYNTPSACYFDVNLNVGTSYVQGASIFSPSGGSAVVYNGSTTEGFLFSFDGTITYSQSATSEVSITMISELFVNAVLASQSIQQVSILSSASLNVGFTKVLTLPAAASVTMTVRFAAGLTTTFTACGFASITEVPYYSLSQYT